MICWSCKLLHWLWMWQKLLPRNFSTSLMNQILGARTFCQFDILSTRHFVNMTFVSMAFWQHDILSKWHFITLSFHLDGVLSTWHSVNMTFCKSFRNKVSHSQNVAFMKCHIDEMTRHPNFRMEEETKTWFIHFRLFKIVAQPIFFLPKFQLSSKEV